MLIYLLLANALGAVALLALALISGKGDTAEKFSTFRWYVLVSALLNILYVTLRGLSIAGVMPVRTAALAYIATYNVSILILSALVFLLVHDLYREATVHLPGMESLGSLIFYGSVVISGIMAVGVVFSPHLGYASIPLALFQIERCSYILVLCLFTFFAFTAQRLGMTYGSRVFGITFGMATLATDRLVANALNAFFSMNHSSRVNVGLISEFVQIGVVALWMVYFLKAEPERRLVTVDLNSSLVRWNEVARFFDKPAGQVVVSSPSTFAPEVREVVASAAAGGAQRPPNLGIAANATSR